MRAILELIGKVAIHDVPVLIVGETGSGKSTLAQAVHDGSRRAARAFVSLDCEALAGKSSPLSAALDRSKRILRASVDEAAGGTLLLDEVGALPGKVQLGVLALVERGLRASTRDARLLATTHMDLDAAVRAGRFREDLLCGLSAVEVHLPSLRERVEDILPLARQFLQTLPQREGMPVPELTTRAEQALLAYSWPGNLREPKNVMQRSLILSRGRRLDVDVFPERLSLGLPRP